MSTELRNLPLSHVTFTYDAHVFACQLTQYVLGGAGASRLRRALKKKSRQNTNPLRHDITAMGQSALLLFSLVYVALLLREGGTQVSQSSVLLIPRLGKWAN